MFPNLKNVRGFEKAFMNLKKKLMNLKVFAKLENKQEFYNVHKLKKCSLILQPAWMQEILDMYEDNSQAKELLTRFAITEEQDDSTL